MLKRCQCFVKVLLIDNLSVSPYECQDFPLHKEKEREGNKTPPSLADDRQDFPQHSAKKTREGQDRQKTATRPANQPPELPATFKQGKK